MSFDGPCSVLRGGMHSFPFSSATEGPVPRDHLQHVQQSQRVQMARQQHQHHQHQHQPAVPAFSFGSITSVRRSSGERKENTEPMHGTSASNDHLSSMITSSGMGGVPAVGSGWDPDEPLPPIMETPRLRSVSSLVLSSDGEGESLPLGEILPSGCPRSRGGPRESSGWSSSILDDLSTSLRALPPPPPLPQLSSANLPNLGGVGNGGSGGNQQRLPREQSFPPPDMPGGGPRRLSREPSFPPLDNDMSLVGTQALLQSSTTSVSAWRSTRIPGPSERASGSGALAVDSTADGRQVAGSIPAHGVSGESRSTGEFHRFGGSESVHDSPHVRSLSTEEWDTGDGIGGIGGDLVSSPGHSRRGSAASGVAGDTSDGLLSPSHSRLAHHSRGSSFDELAAMIPGIPHHLQPPNAARSAARVSAAPAPVEINRRLAPMLTRRPKPMIATPEPKRGRSSTHKEKAHRRSKGEHGIGGPKRRNSGRLEDVAGAAGPASSNGGPVDLAKQARREAAIKRYLHKRSRRKFANSTRDASPSRSRPKAAKIRPRLYGKFVKVVPDFIPVTAVVTEGGGGNSNVKMGEVLGRNAKSIGKDGGRGRVGGHGVVAGVKRELRGSGGGIGRLHRSSFQHHQHKHKSSARNHGGSSGLASDGFSPLWHTSPSM